MPCFDDRINEGNESIQRTPKRKSQSMLKRLNARTKYACLAMRIIEELIPSWTPRNEEEAELSAWFITHKQLDADRGTGKRQ